MRLLRKVLDSTIAMRVAVQSAVRGVVGAAVSHLDALK